MLLLTLGNSGGPLISPNGEVIGINTVKITSAEGIGFAVPINVIKTVIENYITQDSFDEAYLGIFAYDKEIIPYINNSPSISSGVYIVNINENSPAFTSGIKVGDVISSVDGHSISSMLELRSYIYSKHPGDVVSISVNRGYVSRTYDITLDKK